MGLGMRVFADSCGTSNYHIGDSPDPRTLRNARQNGIDIHHVGRQIQPGDLVNHDYILAMDNSNYENILKLKNAHQYKDKIMLVRHFDPDEGLEVPDPYFGGEEGFQEVYKMLDRTLDNLILKLELR